MNRYRFHIPAFAHSMYGLGINEADARKRFRQAQGFVRLPAGTLVFLEPTHEA